MKLLSPKEVKTEVQDQLNRGRDIDKYVSTKVRELNTFKTEYEKRKKAILDDFQSFVENITGEKVKLEGRFASLEARRGAAFKSLSHLALKAEKDLAKVEEIESTFAIKEKNLEARESKVSEEIKKTAKRELELNKMAEANSKERIRLDKYDNDLQSRANKIAAGLQERENKIGKKEEAVDNQLEELNLAIQANTKTAELLDLREKNFEKYKEEQERLLQDKRDTLNRAWSELSTK
jgi:chromosome segregation ATPase